MEGFSITTSLVTLIVIIIIGVVFDIIGIAVTAASEVPFLSMASKKKRGAINAVRLIRKADQVSSFCNDVVGDICSIISGSAGRSEEHTSELQSRPHLVCRLLLE